MSVRYRLGIPLPDIDPETPPLPDITTGLRNHWRVDHATLALDDGASVTALPAFAGSKSTPLDQVHATTTRRPTVAVGALPSGNDGLRFVAASSQFIRTSQYATGQRPNGPSTRALLLKRASSTSQIFWTGATDSVDSTAKGMSITGPSNGLAATSVLSGGASQGFGTYDADWHRIIVTFDGANRQAYLDGVLVASSTELATGQEENPRETFGSNSANSANFFDGLMAEIRDYDRVLTATDIAGLDASMKAYAGL